jgi:CRP-like cAMP-binding protein
LFVIETGLVRSYFIRDNHEINAWFGFENAILGSAMPLFYDQPSFENIQFLETTTYHYISSKDLNELYRKFHEMSNIGRKIAEECCVVVAERAMSLQTENAEQRYNSLQIYQPSATQRISLGHIASYLGIKQETLSRIRRK